MSFLHEYNNRINKIMDFFILNIKLKIIEIMSSHAYSQEWLYVIHIRNALKNKSVQIALSDRLQLLNFVSLV